jgi:hypothetical protein
MLYKGALAMVKSKRYQKSERPNAQTLSPTPPQCKNTNNKKYKNKTYNKATQKAAGLKCLGAGQKAQNARPNAKKKDRNKKGKVTQRLQEGGRSPKQYKTIPGSRKRTLQPPKKEGSDSTPGYRKKKSTDQIPCTYESTHFDLRRGRAQTKHRDT